MYVNVFVDIWYVCIILLLLIVVGGNMWTKGVHNKKKKKEEEEEVNRLSEATFFPFYQCVSIMYC